MKHILCFGDSNTFGTNPSGGRWPLEVRWTGKLQTLLGNSYRIIEEGCGGRTTVWADQLELFRCGRQILPILLSSHSPLDLIIIMLGTNDLKERFSLLPFDVANGAGELVKLTRKHDYAHGFLPPKVLLVSPIHVGEQIERTGCFGMNATAAEKSKRLLPEYERVAKQHGCALFNAAAAAGPSLIDNLHMDAASHEKLAQAFAHEVHKILG